MKIDVCKDEKVNKQKEVKVVKLMRYGNQEEVSAYFFENIHICNVSEETMMNYLGLLTFTHL